MFLERLLRKLTIQVQDALTFAAAFRFEEACRCATEPASAIASSVLPTPVSP